MGLTEILQESASGRLPVLPQIERTTAAAYDPVSLADAKDYLRIDETDHDTLLTGLITTATRILEDTYGVAFIGSSFKQTQNLAPRMVKLLRFPVLSVESVKTIADDNADTEVLVASTDYMRSGRFLRARSVWPTHRQWQSFIVRFTAGYAALGASPTAPEIAAARAAVPDYIRRAVMQLTGHLYENPEGQGTDVRYEIQVKNYGDLPMMIQRSMQPLQYKNGAF